MEKKWHNISASETLEYFNLDKGKGLSTSAIQQKQEEYGKNRLPKRKPPSDFELLLEQFKNPLIFILAIAAGVSFVFKEYNDGFVILGAMFLNTLVGFFQERKASNILYELEKTLKTKAIILRDGHKKEVLQEEIVPGDILVLKAGEKVPADGRIIEASGLKTNEAPLTGEWMPQNKKTEKVEETTPLADRENMVYMGSMVEAGKGIAVAVHTGVDTEIGRVAEMVSDIEEEKTPYQKKITRFSRLVGIFLFLICVGIFVEGLLKGKEFFEMFEISIAVAVASIPEGLPVAMTTVLALGMQRILKKEGLVRRLSSVETLGSTSTIATDKTLTLTQGKMKVDKVVSKDEKKALEIASICANGFIENPEDSFTEWEIKGGPTDRALILGAAEKGVERPALNAGLKELDSIPFDSELKITASLRERKTDGDKNTLFISGAPERVLGLANPKEIKDWQKKLEKLTGKGLRVIAVARKDLGGNQEKILKEEWFAMEKGKMKRMPDLTFVGLIALRDPLREDVKDSIETCRKAGMRPLIVTGDHLFTAKAVGQELGFNTGEENIILGEELDNISDEELDRRLEEIEIYARVEPRHKLRIIKAWQKRKEVVAMTGDGINDAPALKKADVGVALGSGTEVAKQASDLILLEDSFSTLVLAVREGRSILDNIRKVTTYLISDSFTEIILIGVGVLAGTPLPVTALQILWVNLVEDGLPGIALAFEPEEEGVMEREPEPQDISLLTEEMKALTLIVGIVDDITLLGLFFWLFKGGGFLPGLRTSLIHGRPLLPYVRTVVFANLAIDTLYVALACKNLKKNIWEMDLLSNRFLIFSEVVALFLIVGAIYLPFFQSFLETVPLDLGDWALIILVGIFDLSMIEITKHFFIVRRR